MPRTTIMMLRNVESAMALARPVTCPAGETLTETLEGPACHCRIEKSVISVAKDIQSWSVYCTSEGGHEICPTWRAAREKEWRHEAVEDLIAPDGLRRTFSLEDVEEVEERRAAGDLEGAREVWARIAERRAEQGLMDVDRE